MIFIGVVFTAVAAQSSHGRSDHRSPDCTAMGRDSVDSGCALDRLPAQTRHARNGERGFDPLVHRPTVHFDLRGLMLMPMIESFSAPRLHS